jgi:hypothetical protein
VVRNFPDGRVCFVDLQAVFWSGTRARSEDEADENGQGNDQPEWENEWAQSPRAISVTDPDLCQLSQSHGRFCQLKASINSNNLNDL